MVLQAFIGLVVIALTLTLWKYIDSYYRRQEQVDKTAEEDLESKIQELKESKEELERIKQRINQINN